MEGHRMNAEARTYDKDKWGDGPWQTEPDRVEFEHAGFPCLLLRNHYGVWCGYVATSPGHLYYGADYGEVGVDVHGGLTYGDYCQGDICHVPKSGEPDNVYWLGFDCGHAFDLSPGMAAFRKEHGFGRDIGEQYRDVAYARAEAERLAEQLAKVTT
jgi:hypothetical protein